MLQSVNPLVGRGQYTYEVELDWLKLPDQVTLGYTHGVVVDSQDHVYVFHTGSPSIVEFDASGSFIRAWGNEFEGGAHGFYLHRETEGEFLYVTDTQRGLMVKMALTGETVLSIGPPDRSDIYDDNRKLIPTDVAVAPNGNIYVADGYGESWIHQYDAKGGYIQSWGGPGAEPGQLKCPHGVSVDVRREEPEVYVADRGNHRIQVFTLDGKYKRVIADDMDMPCSFYFHKNELFFPDLHSRVTIFDKNDQLITHLGEDQPAYKQDGWPNLPKSYYRANKFSSPHGVCVDSKCNVYVAEWISNGRITKLNRTMES